MYYNQNMNLPSTSRHPYYSFYDYHTPPPPPLHHNFHQAQQRERNYRGNSHKVNSWDRPKPTAATSSPSPSPSPSSNSSDLKRYSCPGCSSVYDYSNRSNRYCGKVPLILDCRHTVCQECIHKAALLDNIICPVCKHHSELSNKHLIDNLAEAFPPNMFLIGVITWSKIKANNINKGCFTFVPTQVTLNNRKLKKQEEIEPVMDVECREKCCFSVCNKVAEMYCNDCKDNYCSDCCTIVHKSAKSLWSHEPVPVQNRNNSFSAELVKCSEHNMDVEFLCKTCEMTACCYCFIEKHGGHEKENLSKLSDDELNELYAYKEETEQVFKQLLISQRKIKDLNNYTTSVVERTIGSYFADLYAQLYYAEKNLLLEVANFHGRSYKDKDFDNIISSLNTSLDTLKYILMGFSAMDVKKLNLRALLQNAKDIKSTPCYLYNKSDEQLNPLKFEASPVLDNVENLFKITKSTEYDYTLVSTNELTPNYTKDPADQQYEREVENYMSSLFEFPKREEFGVHNKKKDIPEFSQTTRRRKNAFQQLIGDSLQIPVENEKVEVTHIDSLECFYVQFKKFQSRFIQMNKDIENHIKMETTKVEQPQIGELYLALYVSKKEKNWCRGRLVEINPSRCEQLLYNIFFIDYGSTQALTIDKLRKITPTLAQKKPFAVQCELYNPTFVNWRKNAHVYMAKVINGKDVYMMVKSKDDGIYKVDLMISSSDGGLTSVVDILIQTCSNALSTSSDSSSISSQKKDSFISEHKIFSNSNNFHKKQMENVIIANVVDPHHIFVHIECHAESFRKMVNELKIYYKTSHNYCCFPVEGTFVIVEHKDPIRGNWHRALVKKVNVNAEQAQVWLVDWGNNVIVPWSAIRILTENFTRLESQAVLIKLADIEPYQKGETWSDKAIDFLQKNFRTQNSLKMIVHNLDPLEVALFEMYGSVDICINAQLVQEKYADSIGKISKMVEWPQNQQIHKNLAEDESLVATLLKKVDETLDDQSEEEEKNESVVKQQIEVVKVVSPDLIYIKFLCHEELEQNLQKELQIHYLKEHDTKENWEVNEDCVVLYTNFYCRGKILCKESDDYKINIYDKATEIILPKEKMFVYFKYFSKYPNMVFKSHLANIRPAGGENWSLSSIEALEKLLETHKDIYATKVKGDASKKSIPMHMWYTQIKVGGALEASITKFMSINNLLVKLGFAYKQQLKPKETASENSSSTEEIAENLITGDESETEGNLSDIIDKTKLETLPLQDDNSSSDKAGTSSTDWNDIIDDELKKLSLMSQQDSPYKTREAEIEDWVPAFPIEKREFKAWITCAETEGILYLRDETLQDVYKEMEKNIKEYFDKKPPIKENYDWQPGQVCTISYKDHWYRGKIFKVNNPDDIVAIMIDFGSDHNLSHAQLYREILYPKIPAFASKIKLDRIYAKSGAWLSSDYDMLLDIVTEYTRVVIKSPIGADVPLAEVFTDKGLNLNEALVEQCPNLTRNLITDTKSDDDIVVIEEEKELEITTDIPDTSHYEYKQEPLPTSAFKDKTVMSIVSVLCYNKVVIKMPNDTVSDELVSIGSSIQDCFEKQPVLENIEQGMPCICPYAEDGIWYRAKVHNTDGLLFGYVFVFFVDFGNVESVSINDIRMMKPEWFDLPIPCYIATLNFELNTDNHLEHVLQHIKKLDGKNKLVHVASDNPLMVDLFEKNGELCYSSFISSQLIKITEV